MKILFIIFILSFYSAFSLQEKDEQDWSLDTLDYRNLDFDDEVSFETSTGWFPRILSTSFSYIIYYAGLDIYDEAKIRNSSYLAPSKYPLQANFDLDKDERIFREKFSKEEGDDESVTSFGDMGLGLKMKITDYNYLRLNIGYTFGKSLLGSIDKSKKFLTADGKIKTLKEANLLQLTELGVAFNLGFEIPIYGAFVRSEEMNLESYYHLYFGVTGSHYFSSTINQYLQIANAKDEIRYHNGKDTLRLINEKQLDNIILTKYRFEIGLGWRTNFDGSGIGYELTYSYPLTNVLTDQSWRQHIFKLNVSLFLGSHIFE